MAARTRNFLKKKHQKKNRKKPIMAECADLYELYEATAQKFPERIRYIDMTFEEIRNREPVSFREDFCGTASAACERARQDRNRYAYGVDYDREVLDKGSAFGTLMPAAKPAARGSPVSLPGSA